MSVNQQSKRLQQQKAPLDAIVSMDKEGCQYQVLFIIKDVIPLNKINYQVCDPLNYLSLFTLIARMRSL